MAQRAGRLAAGLLCGMVLACAAPGVAGPVWGEESHRTAPPGAAPAPAHGTKSASAWFLEGRDAARRAAREAAPLGRPAKNVILFVGDGMGVSTVTAARILEGQRRGRSGEDHFLSFETLPWVALSRTASTTGQVSESASTITAMMTGVKTADGVLGMDEAGRALTSLVEIFERAGRSTGVVTTSRLTHATPAGCYAHTRDRDEESDADVKADGGREAGATADIARQLVEWGGRPGDGLEVAMGGGRANFLPDSLADPEQPERRGRRRDGRDLTLEWAHGRAGSAWVWNAAGLEAIDAARATRLLGLFEPSHMNYEAHRAEDKAGEPSLARMTERALEILSRNPRGFFLMVEGGRIDHAHHDGNAYHALDETIAFAAAVEAARRKVRLEETLLVVTADHSHPLTIAGYPARGNPILGLAGKPGEPAQDLDGLPFTTLGYANGPGAARGARPDLRQVDTAAPGYRQQATIPLRGETHAGEDVPVYAGGAGGSLFHGVIEQHAIFHLIVEATGLEAPAPR